MEVERRLHDTHFAQRVAAGDGVDSFERDDGLRPGTDPGTLLRRSVDRYEQLKEEGEGERGRRRPQSDSAAAARTGVSAARR